MQVLRAEGFWSHMADQCSVSQRYVMQVPGLKERHHRHGVEEPPLMKALGAIAVDATNLMLKLAPNVARNYIIDHTKYEPGSPL